MRKVITIIFALQFSLWLSGQGNTNADKLTKAKDELRQLFNALNDARIKHDRAALERIYADEFMQVHAAGFIDDKATTISEIMETDSIRAMPLPPLDNLIVNGDIAILKHPSFTMASTVASGRLFNTFIYARRNGSWQILQGQGTVMQPERKAIKLNAAALDAFTGKYERQSGQIRIIRQDSVIVVDVLGRGIPRRQLMAVSDTKFYDKLGTEYTFMKEGDRVTQFTVKFANGQLVEWKKVE